MIKLIILLMIAKFVINQIFVAHLSFFLPINLSTNL